LDGSDIRIGIIRTRWNEEHVKNLVAGCRKSLKECKVKDENIFETTVPGSYELPLAARFLALSGTVDAIVTAGVLIKGEVSKRVGHTMHVGSHGHHHLKSQIFFLVLFSLRLFILSTFLMPCHPV